MGDYFRNPRNDLILWDTLDQTFAVTIMSKHPESAGILSHHRSGLYSALSGLMLLALSMLAFSILPPSMLGQSPAALPKVPAVVKPPLRHPWRQASASEIRKLVQKHHALPEDPVAAVHRLLALPPLTAQNAAFQGNQTAIVASTGDAFMMVRQPDCSLTALNAGFTPDVDDTEYTEQSSSPHYDQTIHTAAGLTTTATEAAGRCHDPGVGTQSNTLVYVGLTTGGMRVGALATYNGTAGMNQVFTIISTAGGMPVSTNMLAASTVAGTQPYALAAADLNGDGNNDLVSVNYGYAPGTTTLTSSVTVYLGNADGSFNSGQSYAIPNARANGGLVIDDIDGDGKLDLVIPSATGTTSSYQITFLPGNGDGTFGTAKTTSYASLTATLANLVTGDFNGDGKKDLVSGSGLMLLGNGDGTFAAAASKAFDSPSEGTPQAAVGDFNNDGKLDVAIGTGFSIVVYLGKGDATFQAGVPYASIGNHGYLTAVDLDGDGNLDLYSGDAGNGIFGGDDFTPNVGYALMGNGDGTFVGAQNPPISTLSGTTTPIQSVQDLNGDGKVDFLALKQPYNSPAYFQTFLGRGDGSFAAGPVFTLSGFLYMGMSYDLVIDSYALVDVNHDGKADLVLLPENRFPGRLALLVALGNGDGSFQTPTVIPFPSLIPGGGLDSPYQVTGLYSSTRADGKAELIYQFLSGSYQAPNDFYTGLATQVVNGDGTLGAPVITPTGTYANSADAPALNVPTNVLDVNGDKTPDLIYYVPAVYQTVNGTSTLTSAAYYQVQPGNADGTFGTMQTINVVDNPADGPVTAADFNGDGKIDLLALGSTTYVSGGMTFTAGELGVALGNGDGTFQAPKLLKLEASGGGFESIAAADFDGDGKVDVAILGYDPPTDSGVFFGNGDGTFQSVASGQSDNLVVPVQPIYLSAFGNGLIADVNGDGKPDIIGSAVLVNQYGAPAVMPTLVNSTTTLTATPSTLTVGQSVVLDVTVAASSGSAVPTGTVTFLDGMTSLGVVSLDAQGLASLPDAAFPLGAHAITAVYAGDNNFNGSTSSVVLVTVNPLAVNSTTTLTATPSSVTAGSSVALTATVAGGPGSTVPTGTVTFVDGTASIGTGMLNGMGVATLSSTTLAVGVQSITASYAGDTNFNSSVSVPVSVTVAAAVAPDFTLTLSPAVATVSRGGSAQTTISLAAGGGFSGPVNLSCSGVPADATCNISSATVNVASAAGSTTMTVQTGGATAKLRGLAKPGANSEPLLALVSFSGLLGWTLRRKRLAFRLCMVMLGAMFVALSGCSGGKTDSTGSTGSGGTPVGTYTISVTASSGTVSHVQPFTLTVQ